MFFHITLVNPKAKLEDSANIIRDERMKIKDLYFVRDYKAFACNDGAIFQILENPDINQGHTLKQRIEQQHHKGKAMMWVMYRNEIHVAKFTPENIFPSKTMKGYIELRIPSKDVVIASVAVRSM